MLIPNIVDPGLSDISDRDLPSLPVLSPSILRNTGMKQRMRKMTSSLVTVLQAMDIFSY